MPAELLAVPEYESLQIEQPETGIKIVRLNRPERLNALVPEAVREIFIMPSK